MEITRGGAAGEFIIRSGTRVRKSYAVAAGPKTWVFLDGAVYEIQREGGPPRRRSATHEAVTAPMPATVVRIHVKPGDAVARGDTLIVLEAMKMELPIRAPGDGTVDAVHCREGELVQPGVSLLEFK